MFSRRVRNSKARNRLTALPTEADINRQREHRAPSQGGCTFAKSHRRVTLLSRSALTPESTDCQNSQPKPERRVPSTSTKDPFADSRSKAARDPQKQTAKQLKTVYRVSSQIAKEQNLAQIMRGGRNVTNPHSIVNYPRVEFPDTISRCPKVRVIITEADLVDTGRSGDTSFVDDGAAAEQDSSTSPNQNACSIYLSAYNTRQTLFAPFGLTTGEENGPARSSATVMAASCRHLLRRRLNY